MLTVSLASLMSWFWVMLSVLTIPVALLSGIEIGVSLDDTCSHQEASLSEGDLDPDRCAIECPLHGSSFDLRTGEPLSLPAVEPVRAHQVEVDADGVLRVALAEDEDAA